MQKSLKWCEFVSQMERTNLEPEWHAKFHTHTHTYTKESEKNESKKNKIKWNANERSKEVAYFYNDALFKQNNEQQWQKPIRQKVLVFHVLLLYVRMKEEERGREIKLNK